MVLSEDSEETFLCVFLGGGRLGAALYEAEACRLSLFRDTPDGEPDWEILRSLVHQTEPQHMLICARQDISFKEEIRHVLDALYNIGTAHIVGTVVPFHFDADTVSVCQDAGHGSSPVSYFVQ